MQQPRQKQQRQQQQQQQQQQQPFDQEFVEWLRGAQQQVLHEEQAPQEEHAWQLLYGEGLQQQHQQQQHEQEEQQKQQQRDQQRKEFVD